MGKTITSTNEDEYLGSFDSVSIMGFSPTLKTACDTNGVYKCVALWPLTFFMKKAANIDLISRMLSSKSGKHHNEWKLTSYGEVVRYILEMYATDNVIAEMHGEVLPFTEQSNMTPTKIEGLRNKAVCCDIVFDWYVVQGIFIKRIPRPIQHSIC